MIMESIFDYIDAVGTSHIRPQCSTPDCTNAAEPDNTVCQECADLMEDLKEDDTLRAKIKDEAEKKKAEEGKE